MNTVTNLWFPSNAGKFLSNEAIFPKNSVILRVLIRRKSDLAKNRTSFFSNRSNKILRKWGMKMISVLRNMTSLN